MRKIFERIEELIRSGAEFMICTVTDAKGSTPRHNGALMIVEENGRTTGSVGGGLPEYECVQRALALMRPGCKSQHRERMHFDLYPQNTDGETQQDRREERESLYICGGEMDIELAFVSKDDSAFREELLDKAQRKHAVRVFVFGGGHVAQALTPLLEGVDFEPVVYEERPEFADKALFKGASRIICAAFSDVAENAELSGEDFVAIMTRGHIDDYTVLKQILSTDVEYIGLMGSRSKRAILFEKLKNDCFGETDLARIHNPIGLDIGSETPEEIAVSITAEMIAVRAGRKE